MNKVKVGPAFFDSLKTEKMSRPRRSNNFFSEDLVFLFPLFCLILFFGIILVRLFYVQVLRANYYKDLSDANRTRTETVAAPRGIILDRFGRALVANSPAYKIVQNGKVQLLANDEALNLIAQGKKVQNDILRDYLYKTAFAHVLGYTGQISQDEAMLPAFSDYSVQDFVGKSGLEKQYEGQLHGVDGKKLFEVDASGKTIRELGTEAPIAGVNLNTTLDRDVGISVDRAMKGVVHGAVVVSNPRDGGIMEIYSAPSYDPNLFTHPKNYKADGNYTNVQNILLDGVGQPLLDRAISGSYPPGSTFKLITATSALQKGSITGDTQIVDTGILKVGNFSFGNWYFLQYGRTESDPLNVVTAIKRSNDIFFYKVAEQTGVDYISNWARTFGLGAKTHIDLPAEVSGEVPTVEWKKATIGEQWYLGDTYNYGIGQGYLLTTPLQVNMYTDVFANGGTLWQPHLILGQNKVVRQNFIKSQNIDLVREGMRQACDTGGVAWPLFAFKVKNPRLTIDGQDYSKDASGSAEMTRVALGCKTGTAEVGGNQDAEAWITVFAPFYHPEIAVTVLVENGGEGSSVAGPIAKQILTDYFTNKSD